MTEDERFEKMIQVMSEGATESARAAIVEVVTAYKRDLSAWMVALKERNNLRAAVRAADAVFASQDHAVFAKGEEKALAVWIDARAKCASLAAGKDGG